MFFVSPFAAGYKVEGEISSARIYDDGTVIIWMTSTHTNFCNSGKSSAAFKDKKHLLSTVLTAKSTGMSVTVSFSSSTCETVNGSNYSKVESIVL